MIKKILKYLFYSAVITISVILLYRQIQIKKIPAAQKSIPQQIDTEKIPTPKRPGTRSIRIVGPPIKVLKFQLDFKRNPIPLDWHYLERLDKNADVMVAGNIDKEGEFVVKRIHDKGHPKAGQYIKRILNTWNFVQYKIGKIKYYFNVPTKMEHMKVHIDLRGLKKNLKYVKRKNNIKNGMIYYFEGIDRNNIMIIN